MPNTSKENPRNAANDGEKAVRAGQIGGAHHGGPAKGDHKASSPSKRDGSHSDNPGNFANDRAKASEAGRKGGKA